MPSFIDLNPNELQEVEKESFLQYAISETENLDEIWTEDIECIFKTCIENTSNFANLTGNITNLEEYLTRWLKRFFKNKHNNVRVKTGNPPSTLPDPIVDVISSIKLPHLNEDEINSLSDAHIIYMSAENIQGGLLEAFLADILEPYEWYLCYGDIVKSVDFCSSNGNLLQVKNKYNTENSSSVTVRKGTTIVMWYRIKRPIIIDNVKTNVYNWEGLCEQINRLKAKGMPDLEVTEEDYRSFVVEILTDNPDLLCIEDNNVWNDDEE